MRSSKIVRRPRAPVLSSMARRATALIAFGSKLKSMPSILNICTYCFVIAFFGSTKMRSNAFSSKLSNVATIGKRPTNSGIMPNLIKSCGWISSNLLIDSLSIFDLTSIPKPSWLAPLRSAIILSNPTNAPPQINKMFVVSILIFSCWGCLRPPCGGTLATVPSKILSNACCTPSPLTSRVIETFWVLRAILSISSI